MLTGESASPTKVGWSLFTPPKGKLAPVAKSETGWERSLLLAQAQILEMIATGQEPLSAVLNRLCQVIESLSNQAFCSILLLDESGTLLKLGAAPSFPESYQQILVTGIPVGEGEGSCGTAVARKEPVAAFDVNTDPHWVRYKQIPLQHGFRAVWSSPILGRNREVLGTFGMLYCLPCRPRRRDKQLIELSTHLAGIAIERQRADQAIKQSEQRLATLNTDLECQVEVRTTQLQLALDFEATLRRITDKVRDSLDEAQIMQTAVQELAQVMGVLCCDAGLYNLEQQTSTICYEFIQGEVETAKGAVLSLQQGEGFQQQVLQGQTFQCCILAPASDWPRNFTEHLTLLICPLMDDRGVLGDLWLFKPQGTQFEELEIRLAQQVANHCAIALRQARLYQAVQTQVGELEKLNRLKDDFLSTVSHELRSPVSNMKMAIHMLRSVTAPEKQASYLEILSTECQRELDLVNDLLDLQRLEAAEYDLPATDCLDLSLWLPRIIEPFQERAAAQQQQLQVQIGSDVPAVWVNRVSLQRIVTELLNNACKYTAVQGTIQISVKMQQQTTDLWIEVSNRAEILPMELSRIFDKFYRIPHADPWKQGGTGLGLALIRKLVERLQGQLQVRSEQGWTTFAICLPVTLEGNESSQLAQTFHGCSLL